MKKEFFALLFLLLFAGNCVADGMPVMPPDYVGKVFMPEQKAVISWDGSTEQMIIESKITTEAIADLAWLIPIESSTKPVVEEADEQIFFDLADLFTPAPESRSDLWSLGISTASGKGDVEVVEQLSIDIYDITILRATDETALISWLNSNGYAFPEKFPNLLSDYVQSGSFYFIANKINLQNKYPDLEPTHQDFECAQEIASEFDSLLYNAKGIEERVVIDLLGYRSSPACAGVNAKAVAALVVLRLGIATPLKISFTPSKPFYPMLLSSLNVGSGDAKLYFVSKNQPYKDESGLFAIKGMRALPPDYLSDYGMQGDYATLLEWKSSYSSLEKDAKFAETAFDPRLYPTYVPPEEFIFEALVVLANFLLVCLIFEIPFFAVPFILGFAIAYILEQMKNKKSFFAQSNGLIGKLSAAVLALIGPVVFFGIFMLPELLRALFSNYFISTVFSAIGITSGVFLPYYVSMLFGFFFRKSGHKLRYLLGGILVPVLLFVIWFIVLLMGFA